MSTATDIRIEVPAGTWSVDPIHSSAKFEVEHLGISVFRGGFDQLDAVLVSAEDGALELTGSVDVNSVDVELEDLKGHLLSPEFFDAQRHPRINFHSKSIEDGSDGLVISGELEIAGKANELDAHGELRGPVTGMGGEERVSLQLSTTLDRTDYGITWNADLPGGGVALANQVKLVVALELVKG